MRAEDIHVETDEDGFHLHIQVVDGEADPVLDFLIDDPAEFYKRVRFAIEPWLRERKEARREFDRQWEKDHPPGTTRVEDVGEQAYELVDHKHPRFHEVWADAADLDTD